MEALKVMYSWGIIPVIVVGTIFNWWGKYWAAGIAYAVFGILFSWWIRGLKNFIVTKTSYGGYFGQFNAKGKDFFKVYLVSALITLGFGIISTSIIVGFLEEERTSYSKIVFILPIYTGYVLAYAYAQAKLTNTVWNHIELGPLRFHCTLKSFDMVKLYFTNAIGIIASAGFLIPWAVIRTFKYRTDNTHVINITELKEFLSNETETVQATGAEMTEFFDMDLSL